MSGFARNNGTSSRFQRLAGWIQPVLLVVLLSVAPGHASDSAATVRSPADAAPGEQYMRRVWRIQDGLPEDTVQAIEQSDDGYLWIGTTGGLVQFDGSRFRLYDHATTPALAENSVFCVLSTRDSSLWIGTDGGGAFHFHNGRFRAYNGSNGLSNGFVRGLLEDDQGRVWIGTDNGLFQVVQGRIRHVDTSPYTDSLAVHSIIEDREHRIWVGGSALLVFDHGIATVKQLPGIDSENRVKSIVETQDGTVWVGTVGGLNRLVQGKFQPVREIKGTVRALRQTSDGTLWIGTIGHGLYRYANGTFTHWTRNDLLPSNTVLSIFEDGEQQVWIGTQEGMVRLSKTPVSVLPLPGDSDPDVGTISADPNGTIWAVSSGVFAIRDGVARPYKFPNLPDVPVRNVFRDRTGDLWIGTDGSGVYRITHAGVIHYTAPGKLTNNFIRAFLQSRDGAVWVATDEGVSRIDGEDSRQYGERNGLAYFSTRALLEDSNGDIWIGTDHGLSHMRAGVFVHDAVTAALGEEKVWSIVEDNDGALWFGTRNHGLVRYLDGKMTTYTTAQGLASDSIYQLLADQRGLIWVSGPSSISSFAPPTAEQNGDGRLRVNVYDLPYDSIPAQMYGGRQPAGCVAIDGAIWFASSRGAVRVLPQPRPRVALPRVLLTGINADGRDMPVLPSAVFPASLSRLEINFAPLLLRSQENVRFRYRLENFDPDWTYAGTSRVATYTNLPSGKYQFRVEAFEVSNPAAVSEASFELEKRPYFYATWWFVTLCLLTAALLIFAIYQSRIRSLRLRFKAVLEERNRLAREMHDTVIQGCTSISALLEAISSLRRENLALQENLLDHARMQVRSTIDEARQAVWNLRHKEDSVSDLGASAAAIAARTSEEFGIAVHCTEEGRPFSVRGPLARELLMVIREAVYNAALHGRPRSIQINLVYTKEELDSSVSDDGCGFDANARRADGGQHYGIEGMRERVERMGGQLNIVSVRERGTTVSFSIRRMHLQSPLAEDGMRL
ncbi:MAG TPA: two-component regulator propeller domain-containing protein [Acidobacteriaceae bacterium]|nr:two-component regulator propeller domain-containing protein [Acidobacteriaceae bacterium]